MNKLITDHLSGAVRSPSPFSYTWFLSLTRWFSRPEMSAPRFTKEPKPGQTFLLTLTEQTNQGYMLLDVLLLSRFEAQSSQLKIQRKTYKPSPAQVQDAERNPGSRNYRRQILPVHFQSRCHDTAQEQHWDRKM